MVLTDRAQGKAAASFKAMVIILVRDLVLARVMFEFEIRSPRTPPPESQCC